MAAWRGGRRGQVGQPQMRQEELTHSADLETEKAFNRSIRFTQVKLANVFQFSHARDRADTRLGTLAHRAVPSKGTGFRVLAGRENRGRPSAHTRRFSGSGAGYQISGRDYQASPR
jgi:hypothetical protein